MSAASRKKLSLSLRRAAARRKRLGLHKRHFHRKKKMSAASRARLSASLRRAFARRKALHLKRHLKPATIAKLRARLMQYRHRHRKRKPMTAATRAKLSAKLRGRHLRQHHPRHLHQRAVSRFHVVRHFSVPRHRFRLVSTNRQRFRIKRIRTGRVRG